MFGSKAPKCRRCGKSVYDAEEVKGAGASWHNTCFNCHDCHTGLSSITLNDKDGEIYCGTCYGRNFGPKGYGFGTGAGTLVNTGVTAPGSEAKAAPTATAATGGAKFCGQCGTGGQTGKFCNSCGAAVEGASPAPSAPASVVSHESVNMNKARGVFSGGATSGAAPKFGGAQEKCGKCGKSVYASEKAIGGGRVWHDTCFRCSKCGTGLSSMNFADKDGTIYCTACYGKEHGPKGLRAGSAALSHTQ